MINIKNRQRKITLDVKRLEQDTQKVLDALKYTDFDIGILLTTNKTIQKYNREFRGKNKPTDILSFSCYPHLKAGDRIKTAYEDEKNLGDLIISVEYVHKAAQELGIPFEQRMRELVVHGICHLLGYDHEDDADYKKMRKKELFLLKELGYTTKK